MTVTITPVTTPTELYRRYDNESKAQPAYIELDLRAGILHASYDAEVGGAVPFDVHHGFDRRYSIPPLTADAANALMERMAPLAGRIVADWEEHWDGNNMVARLGEDAHAAEGEILTMVGLDEDGWTSDPEYLFDSSMVIAEWDTDSATNGSEVEEYGITADTTDERLDEIAKEITADLAASSESGVAVVHGLDAYLREQRDELAAGERMTDAEFRVLREGLGVTGEWLGKHLEVSDRTVRNWEAGKYEIPIGVGRALRALAEETAELVQETVDELVEEYANGPEPELVIYRTDADYEASGPEPRRSAGWHRMFVARVAQQVPVTIRYA